MFFSNKPQLLLCIRRTGFDLFGKIQGSFDFPQGIVQNLEVEDQRTLHEYVVQFLDERKIKNQKMLCLLAENFVFQKILPATPIPGNTDFQDFTSKVPFDKANVKVVSVKTKDQVVFIAANWAVVNPILNAFSAHNCRTEQVSPLAVFGLNLTTLNQNTASTVLANHSVAGRANLLQS